jgi:hypothetical protein
VRLGLRIAVALIAVAAYALVTIVLLWQVDWARSQPERLLKEAIFEAQWRGLDARTRTFPSVCGYPASGERALSHVQVVEVARCLHRRGYLSAAELAKVSESDLSLPTSACRARSMPPFARELWCGVDRGVHTSAGVTYFGGLYEQPWWVEAIWLGGLALVVWLVAFRLPFWRSERDEPTGGRLIIGISSAGVALAAVLVAFLAGRAGCEDLYRDGNPLLVNADYVLPFVGALLSFAALRLLVVAGGWVTWAVAAGLGVLAFTVAVAASAVGGLDAGCFIGSSS